MTYKAGPITYSVSGDHPVPAGFPKIIPLAAVPDGNVDATFEFVQFLPPMQGVRHVSLDNFDIASDRIRMTDRLFACDLFLFEKPARIVIASAPEGGARRLNRNVRKSWRYFHTHGSSSLTHYIKRFVYYIYMPVMEFLLIQKEATFAHSSAIEKNGKVVLFPAWGGVGKTSIMSIYLDKGWKFLSDDSCIIHGNGAVSIHPLPIHIYKYHEIQCDKLVSSMLANTGPIDRLLWRGLSKFKKQDRLVRWVGPDQVFGRDKISRQGIISGVLHLHRVRGIDNFEIQEITPRAMSRLMSSTMMDEINNLALLSEVTNSVRLDSIVPDVAELFRQISSIYEQAFASVPCKVISLPRESTARDLYNFLDKYSLT